MSATKLYGLVLAGGKSKRMGKDKGNMVYHQIPQREHTYKLLDSLCQKTFFSIRADQETEIKADYNYILDDDNFRGPYNGIMSAHAKFPEVAWLILATDLPLLKKSDLQKLIDNRDPNKLATAFATNESRLPEPLVALWEPSGLRESIAFLNSQQGTCPRKFLINSNIELVNPDDDAVLMNANTVEDYQKAQQQLQSH